MADEAFLQKQVARRRTFAIISHPDAGKTTLTEKLLLYGGAIHLAGAVRAKANQRHATSDWMEIEKQRGISISSSVLPFEYQGTQINLLDTPGHEDFSEDTYRTLNAADAAVMLIDAAKGVEPQTRKLFEVCRNRSLPIFTFINKLDRPSRNPFDLIDELEKILSIRSFATNWPVGLGDQFRGIYDRIDHELLLFQRQEEANAKGQIAAQKVTGIDDPRVLTWMHRAEDHPEQVQELHQKLKMELELLEQAGDAYVHSEVLEGKLTPIFFGSAMNNFGVQKFLEKLIPMAPPPSARKTSQGTIEPTDSRFSGFIFKIQANIDPSHRDRVAFLRVCSGHFLRNIEVLHARSGKTLKLSKPLELFAQKRILLEEAWPGDIVGLLDTNATLRIGDTLCQGKGIEYEAVTRFSPEHFASIQILDHMKRKALKKGLDQLAEEGVIQIYQQKGLGDKAPYLGAVGGLQFEVLLHRLKTEYNVEAKIQPLAYTHARWVENVNLERFEGRTDTQIVLDRDGCDIVLFQTDWTLRFAEENNPEGRFLKVAPSAKY
jgi:peptide chain release factor 3